MKMQLTAPEIRQAIRNYVNDVVGVNLTDKSMAIDFTAGRGPDGLIALLDIQNQPAQPTTAATVIPGFNDGTPEEANVGAALTLVEADPVEAAPALKADTTLGDPVQEAEAVVGTATSTTKLFGKPTTTA